MSRLNVLISGGGIAGCTLAYWLPRFGHSATVVERSGALRSSGAPVDVRGPAADVAERMGIAGRLREAQTRITAMRFLNGEGRDCAHVDLEAVRSSIAPKDIELPRGDLSNILREAGRNDAEFIFGDSIVSLDEDEHGVDVTFNRSPPRRFDLVIGADGLHSIVRRLAFGPEASFVHYAGLYVATVPLSPHTGSDRELIMLNVPGKCVALHPSRGTPLAMFLFWSPELRDLGAFDTTEQKRILETRFAGIGWKVPEFLAAARATDELYFDSVSKVQLKQWARGRIALLGDASSCVSLFGDGSTLAIAGAYTLADALSECPSDHAEALRRYQSRHEKLVAPRQKNVKLVASMLAPRTGYGIALRNRVLLRAISAFAAAKRMIAPSR